MSPQTLQVNSHRSRGHLFARCYIPAEPRVSVAVYIFRVVSRKRTFFWTDSTYTLSECVRSKFSAPCWSTTLINHSRSMSRSMSSASTSCLCVCWDDVRITGTCGSEFGQDNVDLCHFFIRKIKLSAIFFDTVLSRRARDWNNGGHARTFR
jgi:hypothetical protein